MAYLEPQNLWGEPLDLSNTLTVEQVQALGVPPIDPAWVGAPDREAHGTAWKVLAYFPVDPQSADSFNGEYNVHVQLGSENGCLCDYGWSTKHNAWHCWAN